MFKKLLGKISKELLHSLVSEIKKAIPGIIVKLEKIAHSTKNPYDDMIVSFLKDALEDVGLIEKTE